VEGRHRKKWSKEAVMISEKRVFLGLCLVVWFINTRMMGDSVAHGMWLGLMASFISVPMWALVGSLFSGAGLFFFRLARVDVTKGPSLWQKADVGLALACVLKPALGIPF
jgi:hypothetical protein